MTLSPKEIARPRHDVQDIARQVAEQYSGVSAERISALLGGSSAVGVPSGEAKIAGGRLDLTPLPFPIRVVLPWSMLVSDNAKYAPTYSAKRGARMILTEPYRNAKIRIVGVARGVMGGRMALTEPLSLYASVYVPDNRPHDVANFCKIVHDSLQKIVYANDSQLYRVAWHRVAWHRVGVDVDAPRAELEIFTVS